VIKKLFIGSMRM